MKPRSWVNSARRAAGSSGVATMPPATLSPSRVTATPASPIQSTMAPKPPTRARASSTCFMPAEAVGSAASSVLARCRARPRRGPRRAPRSWREERRAASDSADFAGPIAAWCGVAASTTNAPSGADGAAPTGPAGCPRTRAGSGIAEAAAPPRRPAPLSTPRRYRCRRRRAGRRGRTPRRSGTARRSAARRCPGVDGRLDGRRRRAPSPARRSPRRPACRPPPRAEAGGVMVLMVTPL